MVTETRVPTVEMVRNGWILNTHEPYRICEQPNVACDFTDFV